MNINAMMAQAKKMQAEVEKAQAELAKKEFTIEKQGVTVTLFGNKTIKSINVNEILVDPEDKDILEDLIVIAINEGMEQIDEVQAELAPKAPSGMPF